MITTSRLALVVGIFVAAACQQRDNSPPDRYAGIMTFDTASIRLVGRDTARLTVELAESEAQHAMGLMERRTLAPDAGMLFMYPSQQPESSAFWMFRTRIPLDIAFIDRTGTIRTVQTMAPCESPSPRVVPTTRPGLHISRHSRSTPAISPSMTCALAIEFYCRTRFFGVAPRDHRPDVCGRQLRHRLAARL